MKFYETVSLLFFTLQIIIINDIVYIYENIAKYLPKKKFSLRAFSLLGFLEEIFFPKHSIPLKM